MLLSDLPIGFIATTLILLAVTVSALWPQPISGPVGTGMYLFGMGVNEMPVVVMLWAVPGAVLPLINGSFGGLGSLGGLIGFALVGAAYAGLAVVLLRAVRSSHVPEQALASLLGSGWRASLWPARRPDWVRALLLPFLRRKRGVERVRNVAYNDGGRRHLLDVYRHRSRPQGSPVFIHFHGGHFVSGAKNRESLPLLHQLASRGWVCISANYRLTRIPDYVVDAKRVIAWVREHGDAYGADPSAIFVGGNSAGGYLASFAALTPNLPQYQPGFEDADTSVTAAVSLYGYYGRTDGRDPFSSPAAHISSGAPPFFVAHGHRDTIVPVGEARNFVGALRTASHEPVVYVELPDAQHSFDYFNSLRAQLVGERIEAFAAWVRTPR